MNPRLFINVDPRILHLPTTRLSGADPMKLNRQIAQFGYNVTGMPPLEVHRGLDGLLQIFDGVTRATRVAKLLPGQTVNVEIVDDLPRRVGRCPTIGDVLP